MRAAAQVAVDTGAVAKMTANDIVCAGWLRGAEVMVGWAAAQKLLLESEWG